MYDGILGLPWLAQQQPIIHWNSRQVELSDLEALITSQLDACSTHTQGNTIMSVQQLS